MNTELLTSDVRKLYFKYLLPSLGGVLATSIYSTVDTIAVGQACGPDGAAAIAVINPLFAIFNFIGLLFGIGASVEMSRAKGEGNREKADRIFSVSLILLAVAGIVSWTLISLFLEELLYFCGADDVLLPYAMDYSFWIVLSYPLFLFNVFMAPVIRYDEKPDTIMKATLAGGLFNVFGAYDYSSIDGTAFHGLEAIERKRAAAALCEGKWTRERMGGVFAEVAEISANYEAASEADKKAAEAYIGTFFSPVAQVYGVTDLSAISPEEASQYYTQRKAYIDEAVGLRYGPAAAEAALALDADGAPQTLIMESRDLQADFTDFSAA